MIYIIIKFNFRCIKNKFFFNKLGSLFVYIIFIIFLAIGGLHRFLIHCSIKSSTNAKLPNVFDSGLNHNRKSIPLLKALLGTHFILGSLRRFSLKIIFVYSVPKHQDYLRSARTTSPTGSDVQRRPGPPWYKAPDALILLRREFHR